MSDDIFTEIKKLVSKIIHDKGVVFNGAVDPNKLPDAIAEAVSKAICYYDEHRS